MPDCVGFPLRVLDKETWILCWNTSHIITINFLQKSSIIISYIKRSFREIFVINLTGVSTREGARASHSQNVVAGSLHPFPPPPPFSGLNHFHLGLFPGELLLENVVKLMYLVTSISLLTCISLYFALRGGGGGAMSSSSPVQIKAAYAYIINMYPKCKSYGNDEVYTCT